jgi:hypothetical protein
LLEHRGGKPCNESGPEKRTVELQGGGCARECLFVPREGDQYIGEVEVRARRRGASRDVFAMAALGFLEPAQPREEQAAVMQRILKVRGGVQGVPISIESGVAAAQVLERQGACKQRNPVVRLSRDVRLEQAQRIGRAARPQQREGCFDRCRQTAGLRRLECCRAVQRAAADQVEELVGDARALRAGAGEESVDQRGCAAAETGA